MGKDIKKIKEILKDYFTNRELYNPAADKEQKPPFILPELSRGGEMDEEKPIKLSEGGEPKMHLHLDKGALHRELGVAQGSKIPAKKLDKALDSENPLLRKRAQFAENAKHWQHFDKGGESIVQGPIDQPVQGALPPTHEVGNGEAPIGNVPNSKLGPIGQLVPSNIPQFIKDDDVIPPSESSSQKNNILAGLSSKNSSPLPIPPKSRALQLPNSSNDFKDYSELLNALKNNAFHPSTGKVIGHVLAGIGDGIIQGVGRAGPGHFSQDILASEQAKNDQLINALRDKFETQFKGQTIQQGLARLKADIEHQGAQETQARADLNERAQQDRSRNILGALGLQQQGVNQQAEQKVAQISAALKTLGLAPQNSLGGLWATNRPTPEAIKEAQTILDSNQIPRDAVNVAYKDGQLLLQHQNGKWYHGAQ